MTQPPPAREVPLFIDRARLGSMGSLLLVLSTLGGCLGAAKHTEQRKEVKEEQLLHDSARLHWEGRRWNDSERAAKFIEEAGQRVLFQDWMDTERESYRIVDFTILEIEITEEDASSTDARQRSGTVYIRVEGYEMPAQILEREKTTQEWYRSKTGWWLSWEDPEDEDKDKDEDGDKDEGKDEDE